MNAGRRSRSIGLLAAAIALTLATGCGLLGGDDKTLTSSGSTAPAPTDSPTPEETVDETPTPEPPSPEPTTSKPKPPKAAPTVTQDPNNFQLPACARRVGKEATKKQVKSALVAAAGKTYWPISAPKLKVPLDVVKSVAWQESGWVTNWVNCDGGYGLMQVGQDTVDHIENTFEKSYDKTDYKQNAVLGANYLAWLTKYFGDNYFKKSYDLSPAKCKTHGSMCLLNMVISGYNAGFGSVDDGFGSKRLPNPAYVDSVRSLMESCFCDKY